MPVAICVERSLEMVVGVARPSQGRRRLCRSTRPIRRSAWLHAGRRAPPLASSLAPGGAQARSRGRAAPVRWIDRLDAGIGMPGIRRRTTYAASNCAYVIYTSGSTGRPKGVDGHPSRSVACRGWQADCTRLDRPRPSCSTPASFDLSVGSCSAAAGGARLSGRRGRGAPRSRLRRAESVSYGVTCIPGRAPAASCSRSPGLDGGLGCARSSAAAKPLARYRWRAIFAAGCRLHNCTDRPRRRWHVTSCDWDAAERRGRAPIGRPIANTQIYILLTPRGQPVPVGVPAELYIGGGPGWRAAI